MKVIIHYEQMEQGRTITADVYCHQLDWVKKALHWKCLALANRKGVIFQHDKAKKHSAKQNQGKIRSLCVCVGGLLPHPPYSADLTSRDFYLFRFLEHFKSGRILRNKGEVKTSPSSFLSGGTKKRKNLHCSGWKWRWLHFQ